MASILRQIVAGPRAKHAETGLDLCYVTDNIIATSGPSQTYPQRAYRNPLDRLVAFLDATHGEDWAIWEFRAEGTGYPDEAVYGRIRHYPWPDHHPPPFRLVPMIMASMRNWLNGEDDVSIERDRSAKPAGTDRQVADKDGKNKRVVVVHCKAGKGRSGSMACSYLISECGWKAEDALARFTQRRMRPNFGSGVSIPSQLRWISYVDRWTKYGKKYVDREIEILEVHVWGLRHGVKVSVDGFADEGKKIKVLHTFSKSERYVVQGDAPGGGGVLDFLGDAWSPAGDDDEIYEAADYNQIVDGHSKQESRADTNTTSKSSLPSRSKSKKASSSNLLRNVSVKRMSAKAKTINPADYAKASPGSPTTAASSNTCTPNASQPSLSSSPTLADTSEPGGMAVIFKPTKPIRVSNSDINISLERRNRAPSSVGLTMVTAVAHVWFNAFFEGNGPEQDGRADDSGVFEIEWDKMDGIKGSSRKGTRAAERISVVWKTVAGSDADHVAPGVVITEPGEGSPVPQMRAADWKGADVEDPDQGRKLGLRIADPGSETVSKASSVKSQEGGSGREQHGGGKESDAESLKAVRSSGPAGEEDVHGEEEASERADTDGTVKDEPGARSLTEREKKIEATKGRSGNPDEASGSDKSREELSQQVNDAHQTEDVGLRGGGQDKEVGPAQSDSEEQRHREEENDGDDMNNKRTGDTTHLGFVKRGKKLLPMHKLKKHQHSSSSSAAADGDSEGEVRH